MKNKIKLHRIIVSKKPDRIVNGFNYYEVQLGSKGIGLSVNKNSFLTDVLDKFGYVKSAYEKNKKDIPEAAAWNAALDNVKWSHIANDLIETVKKLPIGSYYPDWGDWKNEGDKETVVRYGVKKQYVKAKAVRYLFKTEHNLGNFLWMEAYSFYPEFKNPKVGAFIIPVDKPKILKAYFLENKDASGYHRYGTVIKLCIEAHLVPDYTKKYHNFGKFEVTIYDFETKKPVSKPECFYSKSTESPTSYNTTTIADISIDEKWRDKTNKGPKRFYAKVKVTRNSNEASQKSNKATQYKPSDVTGHGNWFWWLAANEEEIAVKMDYQAYKDTKKEDSGILGTKKNDNARKYMAKYKEEDLVEFTTLYGEEYAIPPDDSKKSYAFDFVVTHDTRGEIIKQRDFVVSKMICAVQNVETIEKDNCSPCQFTAISGINGKVISRIFQENGQRQTPIFELSSGEVKKTITIELEKLNVSDIHVGKSKLKPVCYGIGLEPGQKHSGKTVFKVPDLKSQWLEKTDIKPSTNKLNLSLGYNYDRKAVDIPLLNKLSYGWLYKYFLLDDDLKQSYIIHITTCRYPLIPVIINVYPNIKWAITFTMSKAGTKHLENWRGDLSEEKKNLLGTVKKGNFFNFNDVYERVNGIPKKKGNFAKLNIETSFSVKASYDTDVVDFSVLGKNIMSVIHKLMNAKTALDAICGNLPDSESAEPKEEIFKRKVAQKRLSITKEINKMPTVNLSEKQKNKLTVLVARKKLMANFLKLPLSITVDNPKISFGVVWERNYLDTDPKNPVEGEKDKKGLLVPNPLRPITQSKSLLKGLMHLKAEPLLKAAGKLDLIACAEFLPLAGQVIKVIDMILIVGGATPTFSIEAIGQIDVSLNEEFNLNGNELKLHKEDLGAKGTLTLAIEAGVTLGGGLLGFFFNSGDLLGTTSTSYTADAKTGITLAGNMGFSPTKGAYLSIDAQFLGLTAVAKKTKSDKLSARSKAKTLPSWKIIEAGPIAKFTKYITPEKTV